jgi:hypothetical protein
MFTLKSASLDFSLSGNSSFQMTGFTTTNGSFSRNKTVRLSKSNTPQSSDPFSFTKLYVNKVSGNLNLTIDLTSIALIDGCSPTTLTPKGFFIYPEYDASATSGTISFKKASTDGYTGCYGLATNEYKLGLNYLPLVLLGEVGAAPNSSDRLISISTVSGQDPQYTYIIVWGD